MNVRAGWLSAAVLSLAIAAAGCDDGVTNAFASQRGVNGGGGGNGTDSTTVANSTIAGTVVSDRGGLGGVTVVLIGRDSTQTDGTGAFRFATLPAGTYSLSVQVPIGYALGAGQTATRTVTVANGGTATATWTLNQQTTTP